jgi:hypothetical protein
LELSHILALSAKDFPGSPGQVKELIWTPDGCAVVMSWSSGGISLWSTYGAMLMCSLGEYINNNINKYISFCSVKKKIGSSSHVCDKIADAIWHRGALYPLCKKSNAFLLET